MRVVGKIHLLQSACPPARFAVSILRHGAVSRREMQQENTVSSENLPKWQDASREYSE